MNLQKNQHSTNSRIKQQPVAVRNQLCTIPACPATPTATNTRPVTPWLVTWQTTRGQLDLRCVSVTWRSPHECQTKHDAITQRPRHRPEARHRWLKTMWRMRREPQEETWTSPTLLANDNDQDNEPLKIKHSTWVFQVECFNTNSTQMMSIFTTALPNSMSRVFFLKLQLNLTLVLLLCNYHHRFILKHVFEYIAVSIASTHSQGYNPYKLVG